jgi:hypothetical protein
MPACLVIQEVWSKECLQEVNAYKFIISLGTNASITARVR